MSSLIMFGLQIAKIASFGSTDEPKHTMDIQANMPACCEAWFNAKYRNVAKQTESPVNA
jgi:hypothetical protein